MKTIRIIWLLRKFHMIFGKIWQRIGELIKTNRKSGHRHIKITLRFAAAIIAASAYAVGSVTVAAVPPLREWFVGVLYRIIIKTLK